MTSTLILTILLVFSFIVGRFLRRFETPNFVFSGMIYLIFGLLLGPKLGFGVLDQELLTKLEPLTSLLIGIVGCLLGLASQRSSPPSKNILHRSSLGRFGFYCYGLNLCTSRPVVDATRLLL